MLRVWLDGTRRSDPCPRCDSCPCHRTVSADNMHIPALLAGDTLRSQDIRSATCDLSAQHLLRRETSELRDSHRKVASMADRVTRPVFCDFIGQRLRPDYYFLYAIELYVDNSALCGAE